MLMKTKKHKKFDAIFLDRDGVIIEDIGYVCSWDKVTFLPGVLNFMRKINELKIKIFIITNQSGIGRGFFSLDEFIEFNKLFIDNLKKQNIEVKKVYFCPHHPIKGKGIYRISCSCRKPNPGMIQTALSEYNLNPQRCILIGDKKTDILASQNAGLYKSFLIQDNISLSEKHYKLYKNFSSVIKFISV